ncbi:hypothetical protein EYF80_053957 [Liparis tanakae]|uniref:Uncharacterized protein n=1 Tax=Liparis tanakae TaxID=230148 RepID=A0A4Z2F439_9TELE|nr:hypothetical protein EYF80_053957 [Liparis tanakae]
MTRKRNKDKQTATQREKNKKRAYRSCRATLTDSWWIGGRAPLGRVSLTSCSLTRPHERRGRSGGIRVFFWIPPKAIKSHPEAFCTAAAPLEPRGLRKDSGRFSSN